MTKFNKTQITERDALASIARDRRDNLEKAIDALNDAIKDTLWPAIETAKDEYNEAIQNINAWMEDRASEVSEYIDNKSEKWQEGDKGQQVTSWRDSMQESFEMFEQDMPEFLDWMSDVEDASEKLEGFPECAEEA